GSDSATTVRSSACGAAGPGPGGRPPGPAPPAGGRQPAGAAPAAAGPPRAGPAPPATGPARAPPTGPAPPALARRAAAPRAARPAAVSGAIHGRRAATRAGPAHRFIAYVADAGSGTVTPIRTATNTALPPIKVGRAPDTLAITPDGKTVYVANYVYRQGTVT